MTAEKTFHFDNAREAQELTGRKMEFLPMIESAMGVTLTTRDLWLTINGPEDCTERTLAFFDSIRSARNRGIALRETGIQFALSAFTAGRERYLEKLYLTRIDVAPGKSLPVGMSTWLSRATRLRWVSLDVLIGAAKLDNTCGVLIKSGGGA
jgi:hypothetical protein